MRYTLKNVAMGLAILCIGACSEPPPQPSVSLSGFAFGTPYAITLVGTYDVTLLNELQQEINTELQKIDRIASTYRSDSEISAFNRSPPQQWIPVSHEFCRMLRETEALRESTNGAFNAAMAPLIRLWGFGATSDTQDLPLQEDIQDALQTVGQSSLAIDCAGQRAKKSVRGMELDFSGWAKGYAVDQLADLLVQRGIDSFLIEIGGEIRASGMKANQQHFTIGIEHPRSPGTLVDTVLQITDIGLATSGDYKNFRLHSGVRYSHTLDPRTGWPVTHNLASVSVLSSRAADADGYATALLVMGPEQGLAYANAHGIAALFIGVNDDDAIVFMSEIFPSATIPSPISATKGSKQ